MKKINKQLIIDLVLLLFFCITIFSKLIVKETTDLDEIWNYNTARCIANGLIPYKDISMITTPLLPMITAIIFNITCKEMIISRILATLMSGVILLLTYKIFNILSNNKIFNFIIVEIMELIYIEYFCIDYNFFVLLIVLVILYKELKNQNDDLSELKNQNDDLNELKNQKNNKKRIIKYDLIIGILAGLAVCTKQTVGCVIALIVVIEPIVCAVSKKEIKLKISNILSRILGILIPVIMLFIYLLCCGSLSEFISYAILGIKEFTNKISYIKLFSNTNCFVKYTSIILPIILVSLILYFIITNKSNKKLLLMLLYSISTLIIVYPISDDIHFLISNYILIMLSICLIIKLLKMVDEKIKFKEKKYIYIIILSYLIMFFTYEIINNTVRNYKKYFSNQEINYEISDFKCLIIPKYLKNRINDVTAVIKQNEDGGVRTYIVDADASIYDIALNRYYKNYDMFLKGNIGINGEQNIIGEIKNSSNCMYLVKNDEHLLNWQTPTNVIKYIKDYLEKVGSISVYDIYYKE